MFSRVERSACAAPFLMASRTTRSKNPLGNCLLSERWSSNRRRAALVDGRCPGRRLGLSRHPVNRSSSECCEHRLTTSVAFDRDAARSRSDENPVDEPLSTRPQRSLHLPQKYRAGITRRGREPSFPIAGERLSARPHGRLLLLSSQTKLRVHDPHSHALDQPRHASARQMSKPETERLGASQLLARPSPVASPRDARPSPSCGARSRRAGGHSLSFSS